MSTALDSSNTGAQGSGAEGGGGAGFSASSKVATADTKVFNTGTTVTGGGGNVFGSPSDAFWGAQGAGSSVPGDMLGGLPIWVWGVAAGLILVMILRR